MQRLSFLLAVLSLGLALPVQAQKTAEKTVVDYFLAAPSDRLPSDIPDDPNERMKPAKDDDEKTVIVQDIRNQYLKLAYGITGVEVKLFPAREGVVMGISVTGCCCEGRCDRRLYFLSIQNGQTVEVTDKVWPKIDHDKLLKTIKPRAGHYAANMADEAIYKFSRRGTTVSIVAGTLVPFRFRWSKEKFVRF